MNKKTSYELPEDELIYISRYLNGELDASDGAAFEQRLEADPIWQQKVLEVKALLVGVREAGLTDSIAEWREEAALGESTASGASVRPFHRRWWVAAVIVAAVLCGLGVWWSWFLNPSDERLYMAYFVPDSGLPVAMSGTDTSRYAFYDGMISYKEGDYAAALARWASVGAPTDTMQYFNGLAYMGLGRMSEAADQLLAVSSNRRSAYYREAHWYLALCHLRQGNRKTAVSLLKRIDDDERAESLMRKLE